MTQHEPWDAWVWAGWETDRHYRRLGRSNTAFFGRGPWLADWRRRLLDERTLDTLVRTGLRTLVTCFYKGFGLRAEQQQWPWLRQLIAGAHQRGLRVLGYTQGGSLYYETLLEEQPELRDWVARQRDGSLQTWGGSYYRWRPCLTSSAYLDYMDQVVRVGLGELELDGLHFDNSYYRHCWCARCAERFRQWLAQRDDLEDRLGLTTAAHVLPPPLEPGSAAYSDPLQILWMQFGAQVRNEAYARLARTAKQCRPAAVLVGNPAFPRRSNYLAELALDLHHEAKTFDLLFAENGNLPQCQPQELISQAEAYLFADALGYGVLNTAWKTGENEALPPQTPGAVWAVMAEECSYHAAVPGNNWMLRPAGDGERLLADDQARMDAFADASAFFQSVRQLVARGTLRQWGEVGLFVQPLTLSLAAPGDRGALRTAILALLRMGIPAALVLAGQPIPASVRTLLVVQQSCLAEADLRQIADFARHEGHHALVLGQTGRFDAWFLPRHLSAWRAWRAGPGMLCGPEQPLTWGREQDGARYLAADRLADVQTAQAALAPLLARAHTPRQLTATLPTGVLLNVEANDHQLVAHLRDQAGSGQLIEGCQLHLAAALLQERHLTLLAPGLGPLTLTPTPSANAGMLQVRIPAWRHYAVVVVEA